MNIRGITPQTLTPSQRSANAPAAKEEGGNFMKDFFSYTARDSDPHESFFGEMRRDFVHSMPFTAKVASLGAAGGLLLGSLVGAAVLLPVAGGVAGFVAAQNIVDKATWARDMRHLAGVARWELPQDFPQQ